MIHAERDLKTARLVIQSDWGAATVTYHAQQAAEKSVKALIVSRGGSFPKVHDLGILLARLGDDLPAGLPDAADIDELTGYAVTDRYPDDLPDVTVADASWALETAEAVLAAVRGVLGV